MVGGSGGSTIGNNTRDNVETTIIAIISTVRYLTIPFNCQGDKVEVHSKGYFGSLINLIMYDYFSPFKKSYWISIGLMHGKNCGKWSEWTREGMEGSRISIVDLGVKF